MERYLRRTSEKRSAVTLFAIVFLILLGVLSLCGVGFGFFASPWARRFPAAELGAAVALQQFRRAEPARGGQKAAVAEQKQRVVEVASPQMSYRDWKRIASDWLSPAGVHRKLFLRA